VSTRHDEVAEILTGEILRGRYRPGDRLPSERELAARFQVHRGGVREALKKLEQLGLADVQPGGARVMAVHESSLEVIGRLMDLDEVPDPDLIEQVLELTGALMKLAVERALERASDAEITEIRALVARLARDELSAGQRMEARMELVQRFMELSGNLPLRLIARSLKLQLFARAPRTRAFLERQPEEGYAYLPELDRALAERDIGTVTSMMQRLSNRNREQLLNTLRAAREARVTRRASS